jgi:hypothetical protein
VLSRVWVKEWRAEPVPVTEWMTRDRCVKVIYTRWGRWPSFAYISKALTVETFKRRNCDWLGR